MQVTCSYFGNDIKVKSLKVKDSNKRAAYVLMDMIFPATQELVMVSHEGHSHVQISCELGVYGVFVK